MRLELNDFTGGITDGHQSDPRTSRELDNYVIEKDRSASVRYGSSLLDMDAPKIIGAYARINKLFELSGGLIAQAGGQFFVHNSGWPEILPSAGNALIKDADGNTTVDRSSWNEFEYLTSSSRGYPLKMYKDNNGQFQAMTAGLPAFTTEPTVTPQANNSKSYIYYLCYYQDHTTHNGTFHIDVGQPLKLLVQDAPDFSGVGRYISFSDLESVSNLGGASYDLARTKIKIYRTKNGLDAAYLVGTVNYGDHTFEDTMPDSELDAQERFYGTGTDGVHNSPPPFARHIAIHNGIALYLNTAENPNRWYQSLAGDPDSVPTNFFDDISEEITGAIGQRNWWIIFAADKTYRVTGGISDNGSGEFYKEVISDTEGCICSRSIVMGQNGTVYFASRNGFRKTDGYQVVPVPTPPRNIDKRYEEYTSTDEARSRIEGCYDRRNKRVYWTTQKGHEPDTIVVYDETFDALTTWSGGDSFNPTAITMIGDSLIRGDRRGYVFSHEDIYLNDIRIDEAIDPSEWVSDVVRHELRTLPLDFGVSDVNKWVTKVTVGGSQDTNVDLALFSYDNNATTPKELKAIGYRGVRIWRDPANVWRDPARVWGGEPPLFSQTRRFVAGGLRTKKKELVLTNAYVALAQSYAESPESMAVYDAGTKLLTLKNPDQFSFPLESRSYTLVINGREFAVKNATLDTLEVDSDGTLLSGEYHWAVKGYPKSQGFNVNSVIFTFEMLDDDGGYYKKGE